MRETPAEVVERELTRWQTEQAADALWQRHRARMRAIEMKYAPVETLPFPRIGWRDIVLALIGR